MVFCVFWCLSSDFWEKYSIKLELIEKSIFFVIAIDKTQAIPIYLLFEKNLLNIILVPFTL